MHFARDGRLLGEQSPNSIANLELIVGQLVILRDPEQVAVIGAGILALPRQLARELGAGGQAGADRSPRTEKGNASQVPYPAENQSPAVVGWR